MDTTTEELPSNRAGFDEDDTLAEKAEKHRENVEETIERAKDGETVNLSDLMKDAEEIHLDRVEGGR